MRAKQSFTASGTDSSTGTRGAEGWPGQEGLQEERRTTGKRARRCKGPAFDEASGLLHDARNLFGALGLYCELLGEPGVLCGEHMGVADELKLLAERTHAMIERWGLLVQRSHSCAEAGRIDQPRSSQRGVSLDTVAQRCSGVLQQVAGGRTIECSFGPRALLPVAATEDAIERVLLNLIRNAGTAMERREAERGRTSDASGPGTGRAGCIRIRIGEVDTSAAAAATVSMVVEDAGCGMGRRQVARLFAGGAKRDGHGLGFQIVRELVLSAGGEVTIISEAGSGTQVRIDWPVLQRSSSRAVPGEVLAHSAVHGEGWCAC